MRRSAMALMALTAVLGACKSPSPQNVRPPALGANAGPLGAIALAMTAEI